MTKVTWLGDEDPSVQEINHLGTTFVKGVPTTVTDKALLSRIEGNPFFSTDGKKADVVEAKEPVNDPEAGTEIGFLKTELDNRGVKYAANATVETLRKALADSR